MTATRPARTPLVACGIAIAMAMASGCNEGLAPVLERMAEARALGSDLLVQFTKASDAANRAVMADTDEASSAFAREAEAATQAVLSDAEALRPLLVSLDYDPELALLDEFDARFADLTALDREMLELAVENTNLKAQRLSFGAAAEAADAFGAALAAVAAAAPGPEVWRVRALTASATQGVREIQVLQAPHIAEPGEAAMTRLEERMAASEAATKDALVSLAALIEPESREPLAAASAALDRFLTLHAEILALSRRNTNVHSLALALGKRRTLAAGCEESLHALQAALAKKRFTATR